MANTHHSVAGTDAGPGESFAMTTWNATTSMGRGRDTPPPAPHPENKTWPFTQKGLVIKGYGTKS